jgi:hypothetical protein
MSLDTIDGILDALGKLGYPAKLTEVAWLLDKHMRRDKLIELVDGAQYSRRNRDAIDLVLGLVRDELREKSAPRHHRGNPKVVHAFDPAPVAPTVQLAPAANAPTLEEVITIVGAKVFASFETAEDEHHAPIVRVQSREPANDRTPAKVVLNVPQMLQCLAVLTADSEKVHGEVGPGMQFGIARAENDFTLTIAGNGVSHTLEMDAQGAFALSAILTAQIRRAMPPNSREDLTWLYCRVAAPLMRDVTTLPSGQTCAF